MHPTDIATALADRKSRLTRRLMVEGRIALIDRRTSPIYTNVPGIAAAALLQDLTWSDCAKISQKPDRLTMLGITGAGDADTNLGLLQNWQAEAGQWLFDSVPILEAGITDTAKEPRMNEEDYMITVIEDGPQRGIGHTGPNPCWVTVRHNPTGIMARCYGDKADDTRALAMQCVHTMMKGVVAMPHFKERLFP